MAEREESATEPGEKSPALLSDKCPNCGGENSHYMTPEGQLPYFECDVFDRDKREEGETAPAEMEIPSHEKLWELTYKQGEELTELERLALRGFGNCDKIFAVQNARISQLEGWRDSLMTVIGFILTLAFVRAIARRVRERDEA